MHFVGVLAFAEERFVHGEPRLSEDCVLEVGAVRFEVLFAAAREGGGVGSGGLALGGGKMASREGRVWGYFLNMFRNRKSWVSSERSASWGLFCMMRRLSASGSAIVVFVSSGGEEWWLGVVVVREWRGRLLSLLDLQMTMLGKNKV